MTRRIDQPINPGVKPSGVKPDLSELDLAGVTFKDARKGRMIPTEDAMVVAIAALAYWKSGAVPSYKQAYTVACSEYWKLFEKEEVMVRDVTWWLYGQYRKYDNPAVLDGSRCRYSVWSQDAWHPYQCFRKPATQVDGYDFCTQHAKMVLEQLGLKG